MKQIALDVTYKRNNKTPIFQIVIAYQIHLNLKKMLKISCEKFCEFQPWWEICLQVAIEAQRCIMNRAETKVDLLAISALKQLEEATKRSNLRPPGIKFSILSDW